MSAQRGALSVQIMAPGLAIVVRIERALGEELRRRPAVHCDLPGLGLEHVDEQRADRLALGLRIGDAVERLQELLAGVGMDQRRRPTLTFSSTTEPVPEPRLIQMALA